MARPPRRSRRSAGRSRRRARARRCGGARRRRGRTGRRRRRAPGARGRSRRARDRGDGARAELRAEVDSKTAECARLASACASMDARHLRADGEDEKTKEIDARCGRARTSLKRHRDARAPLRARRGARRRRRRGGSARGGEARSGGARREARGGGGSGRGGRRGDEALGGGAPARRDGRGAGRRGGGAAPERWLRERLGRLESVRRASTPSRRADGSARRRHLDRADLATRRAEHRSPRIARARREAGAAPSASAAGLDKERRCGANWRR